MTGDGTKAPGVFVGHDCEKEMYQHHLLQSIEKFDIFETGKIPKPGMREFIKDT
jgi:hypothetical protein